MLGKTNYPGWLRRNARMRSHEYWRESGVARWLTITRTVRRTKDERLLDVVRSPYRLSKMLEGTGDRGPRKSRRDITQQKSG